MDTGTHLRALMKHEERKQTLLSDESLQVTLKGLALLSRHFRRDLDELEMQTYIHGLRDMPAARLQRAFTRALETLKRMPLIADLRELANERSTEALMDQPTRQYCERCHPDGYVLETHPIHGAPYKVCRRCPCQALKA